MKALGREIASRRDALGMSQAALGQIAGCSREAISNLENGKVARPRTDMIVAIADRLGLHENMLRVRGLDVAADELMSRRGMIVHAADLPAVALRLADGASLELQRVGDDAYAISLPDTNAQQRFDHDAYAALGGARRRRSA